MKLCPLQLKEHAHVSLVRSVDEYAARVWDPHKIGNTKCLENIKRKAARFVKNDYQYTSSVTKMLEDLGWKNLAERRRDLRLALLYKIVHGHIAVPTDDILVTADNRTRSNHQYKYRYMSASATAVSYTHLTLPTILRV